MTLASVLKTGLRGRCPKCGQGHLFQGFLRLRPRCATCGEDFSAFDSGDGPAVFAIFAVGTLVTVAAVVVELRFMPPLWLHAALWLPTIPLATASLLRPFKAVLIAMEFAHDAHEHRHPG